MRFLKPYMTSWNFSVSNSTTNRVKQHDYVLLCILVAIFNHYPPQSSISKLLLFWQKHFAVRFLAQKAGHVTLPYGGATRQPSLCSPWAAESLGWTLGGLRDCHNTLGLPKAISDTGYKQEPLIARSWFQTGCQLFRVGARGVRHLKERAENIYVWVNTLLLLA